MRIEYNAINKLIALLKIEKKILFRLYVFAFFSAIMSLSLPLGLQAIIQFLNMATSSTSLYVLIILVLLGITMTGIFLIMQIKLVEYIRRDIFVRASFEFAIRVPKAKMEALRNYYAPELMNRFFETLNLQKGVSKILIDFASSAFQIVAGLTILSFYHTSFVLSGVLALLLVLVIIRILGPNGIKTSLEESGYKYEVVHWLEELARVLTTFKLSGSNSYTLKKTDQLVSSYLKARDTHFDNLMWHYNLMLAYKIIITALFLVLGSYLVISQQMNIGQFVAAEIIVLLVVSSVEKLIYSLDSVYDVLTALVKLGNVTELEQEEDHENLLNLSNDKPLSIEIERLSFWFADKINPVINDISLNIQPGERVMFFGKDGSGKSLLFHLIAGFYDNYRGIININRIPLKNIRKDSLRSLIGDNLSSESIFKASILENICIGTNQPDFEELSVVINQFGLKNFIIHMEEGYDTILDPEGQKLPRSIKAKLLLARAALAKPSLVLLDDNFHRIAEVDQQRILDYFLNHPHKWTLLMNSNNARYTEKFDRIIALKNGEILGECQPTELKKQKWYNQIVNQ